MRQLSIRNRLLALVAVILLPLTLVHLWGIQAQYDATYAHELKASEEYAEAIRTAFVDHVQGIWAAELAIGLTAATENLDRDTLKKLLQRFVDTSPTLTAVVWSDPDGTPLVGNEPDAIDIAFHKQPCYSSVLSGQDTVLTNAISWKGPQNPAVGVIRVIRSVDGQRIGMVVGRLETSWLPRILNMRRLRPSDSFGLVDGSGTVIMRITGQEAGEELEFSQLPPDSLVRTAIREGRTTFTGDEDTEHGEPSWIGAAVPIPEFGWGVFVGSDRAAVLADARRHASVELALTGITLLLALAAAIYIGNNLTRPLHQLERAAQALSLGDNSARADIAGHDELAAAGATFDAMATRLQESEQQRLRFLQSMAHELRNPLTAMKGIIQLIRRRIPENSGSSMASSGGALYNALEDEVTSLSRLLDQMIGTFRAHHEVSDAAVTVKNVPVSDLVSRTVSPFILGTSHNVAIEDNLSGPVYVLGDRTRLEAVLRNLLGNAAKYSAEKSAIMVRLVDDAESVTIAVDDQGRGVPPSDQGRIFDMFYRVKDPLQSDPGGTGIGLYIAREIVQAHGGTIWVESDGQHGSTFYVRLPKARPGYSSESGPGSLASTP